MGTSSSWAELDAKLARLARDVSDLPKTQTREATLIVERSVSALMPSRLRGVGKRGAAINVKSIVEGGGDSAAGRVWVTGPAQLIENDTKAHMIPRQRNRGRRRVVVIPGVGVRASAHHPGTKGKHPWLKGVAAAIPLVERAFAVPADAIMRSIF